MARPIPRLPPVTIAVGCMIVRGGCPLKTDVVVQNESEPRFGGNPNDLSLGDDLRPGSGCRTCARADGCAFSAARNGADDRAHRGGSTSNLGGLLAARRALAVYGLRVD